MSELAARSFLRALFHAGQSLLRHPPTHEEVESAVAAHGVLESFDDLRRRPPCDVSDDLDRACLAKRRPVRVFRLEGFGNLYLYDMKTQQGNRINPVDGACCYRDARFSPDGTHVLILFQDLRLGNTIRNVLYYAPVEALTTGEFGDPIPIPFDLQTGAGVAPQFEFRP